LEEELERDMKPRLIGDLGMGYPTSKSTKKYRCGLYECQYCGKEFEAGTSSVKRGHTKSCGCLRGDAHGLNSNRFYLTWYNMVKRCNNPKNEDYKNYGERGISVCEEWLDIKNFIAWAEATHPDIEGVSLDRIDNDLGYSPENCRWVDKSTQVINQRIRRTNTSGYVGITWVESKLKWVSRINVEKKRIWLGEYKTKEEAVLARDNYIIENNLPHKLSTDYIMEIK
jgi:hypothetical protein